MLARLGNSDTPPLHFQLMDATRASAAEGIPFELESFTQLGVVDDQRCWTPASLGTPEPRRSPLFTGESSPSTTQS